MTCRVFCSRFAGLLALALLPGCIQDEYPEDLHYPFTPYPDITRKGEFLYISQATQAKLPAEIQPLFGTPRHPTVQVDNEIITHDEMRLDKETLERGSQLYRRNCLTCHGLNGDGGGPTGVTLNPRPRDFRQGIFKFKSTPGAGSAPSREDLRRTIRSGIPTASMPSFGLLLDEDVDALASYVIHLGLRGQTESDLGREIEGGEVRPVAEVAKDRAEDWLKGAQSRLTVPDLPGGWDKFYQDGVASNWKRGRELFLGVGGCRQCHGNDARSSLKDPELQTNLDRLDDWGRQVQPRDLTHGMFRGGSRQVDLFNRIKIGIPGSGMPGSNEASLDDKDIWHIVYYVFSLSHQR